jgi:L-cysteine S-thiosulfotransferase
VLRKPVSTFHSNQKFKPITITRMLLCALFAAWTSSTSSQQAAPSPATTTSAPAAAAAPSPAAAPNTLPPPPINGREIFISERKGNCTACHKVPNDPGISSQSNIGPALQAVKAKFPDSAKLRAAIADYATIKPNTIMPPYGKHRILTPEEIDALVVYLESI